MLGQLGNPKNVEVSSPSRQYVAMMNGPRFLTYYFRSFTLPDDVKNDVQSAAHWYMQQDLVGCMEGCFPLESYQDFAPMRPSFSS